MDKYSIIDYENKVIIYRMIKIGGSWFCRVPAELVAENKYNRYVIKYSKKNKNHILDLGGNENV